MGSLADISAGQPVRGRILRSTYFQVIMAIVLGICLGLFFPSVGETVKPLGDAFIKLVRMVIAPIIFLSVVTGISGMHGIGAVGRVAAKAFLYFLCLSSLALVLGLCVANVVQPGRGMNIDPSTLDAGAVSSFVAQAHDASITGFLLAIIPDTLASALTDGAILQVLLVAILFGVSLSLAGPTVKPLVSLLEMLLQVMFRLVAIVMLVAPIGAFGAMAFTVGKYGPSTLVSLAALIGTFYLTSIFFILVVLGVVSRFSGFSILRLIYYLRAELLLVVGTSSSETALPGLLAKLEAAGCDKGVVGLVVPTGYSFNLDGTNIYMTLAALFIAQATNAHLPLGGQVTLLLVAMLSSKGAAGVTGAGFITLAATLAVVPTVPIAGMALILGIDRFMSECRSLTNFIGNAVATIVVARWEGALDRSQLARTLKGTPVATVSRARQLFPDAAQ
jgi:aerobic C4-dicarboxylate transport protein